MSKRVGKPSLGRAHALVARIAARRPWSGCALRCPERRALAEDLVAHGYGTIKAVVPGFEYFRINRMGSLWLASM